jgi:serine/threonine protein kinase
MAMTVASPAPRELKKYELLCRLAQGGMAELWLARSKGLGGFEKTLVIKRILPSYAKHAEFVKMFLDEARIAATLQHSNVVQVFDVDSVDGNVFMAMEFLHGQDLRTILERLERKKLTMPLEHAMAIVLSVCAGLSYAHEKVGAEGRPLDIVHRDVSPANVIVTYDGNVKIIDFGIARATGKLADNTQYGIIKGKLGYMSPEQCLCEPLDKQSDVFCIGILLWEMTVGRPLFPNHDQYKAFAATCDEDAPLPSLFDRRYPPELERIVMKALRRRRDERYPNAQELQRDLEKVVLERKLPVTPFGLTAWMQKIFGRELEAWKVAQRRGRSLADFIATYRTSPTGEVAITREYTDEPTRESPMPDMTPPPVETYRPADEEPANEERGGAWRGWRIMVGVMVVVAVGVAVVAMSGNGNEDGEDSNRGQATGDREQATGVMSGAVPDMVSDAAAVAVAVPDAAVVVTEIEPEPEIIIEQTPVKKKARKKKVVEDDEDDLESVLPR